jgi:hypothetical protein
MDESWFDGKHVDTQGGLRPAPHAGLTRVRAEPPCTMPCRDSGSANREATPHGRSQTRTHGGMGPVVGASSQSRGPDSAGASLPLGLIGKWFYLQNV